MKSDAAFSHCTEVHPSEGLTYQLLCMAHPRSPSFCPFPSILSLPQWVAEERWYLWRRQQKHFSMWCLCKWKSRRWRGNNIAPMMTNTFVSWYILLFLMRTFCWTEWLLVSVLQKPFEIAKTILNAMKETLLITSLWSRRSRIII